MGLRTMPASELRLRAQRDWYHRNKEAVNQRRRQKYARSPGVRNAHRARCRRWWQAKRAASPVVPVGLRRRPERVTFLLGGKPVTVLAVTIGYIAARLGVRINTFRKWETAKYIPKMNWRSRDGARIWPLLFMDICAKELSDTPLVRGRNASHQNRLLHDRIVQQWTQRRTEYLTNPDYGREALERVRPVPAPRTKRG